MPSKFVFPCCLVCLIAGLPGPGVAAEKDPAPGVRPDPEKPYVLFMGADLAVRRDGRLYRVEDVVGDQLKIHVDERVYSIRTDDQRTPVKVNNSVKLGRGTVLIEGLRSGPGYSPASNPQKKAAQQMSLAMGATALQDIANGALVQESIIASGGAPAGGPGAPQGPDTDKYGEALTRIETSGQIVRDAQNNTEGIPSAGDNYDAVETSFRVSSASELEDPHLIVLFRFQEPGAKPGPARILIHAQAIDPVGSRPQRIFVRKTGLPPGFKFLNCEVHLYNRGEEVATNASPKRVELSRAEAQEYLVIEYLGANKRATLPAGVLPGTLRREQRDGLTPDQLDRTFYVRVAANGALIGAYADEACKRQLDDAAMEAALGEVFFRPALDKGKPVEGIGRVRLGDI